MRAVIGAASHSSVTETSCGPSGSSSIARERKPFFPRWSRLVLEGTTRADPALRGASGRWFEELRAVACELGDEAVWIERVELATAPPIDLESVARRDDAIGQIASALRRARTDDAALAALADSLAELRGKLPRELSEGLEPIRLDDPAVLREALEDVERFLVPRLLGSGRS